MKNHIGPPQSVGQFQRIIQNGRITLQPVGLNRCAHALQRRIEPVETAPLAHQKPHPAILPQQFGNQVAPDQTRTSGHDDPFTG